MSDRFFERPILNSPYEYPAQHWELDESGQPTNRILDSRRRSELITPVPKPKKRRKSKDQAEMVLDAGAGLSTADQEYNPTPIINEIRSYVKSWRKFPRRRRSLQSAEDDAQGRDRPESLGHAQQRYVAAVLASCLRPDRGQGHQPSRRRGDEGVRGVMEAARKEFRHGTE